MITVMRQDIGIFGMLKSGSVAMSFFTTFIFFFLTFLFSVCLTWFILRFARRCGWLAVPNHRSSHKVPTPRSGGIAIGLIFLLGLLVLWTAGVISKPLTLAFLGGGLLVSIVSFIDDRRGVHVGIRLVVHFIAVAWALFFIGDLRTINIGYRLWYLDFLTHLVPLGMVWVINMYNFMDGIDGLAGSQAVLVGAVGGAFLALSGVWDLALVSWLLAACVGGFLVWNWPPAKIFMSDVGSILIGFVLAVLMVASEKAQAVPLLIWVILLMVFVVDATFTTVRRLIKGEKWFAGHHNFAFQQLLKNGYSHKKVTLGIMAVNLALVAMVILARSKPALLLPLFAVALIGLALLWRRVQSSYVSHTQDH